MKYHFALKCDLNRTVCWWLNEVCKQWWNISFDICFDLIHFYLISLWQVRLSMTNNDSTNGKKWFYLHDFLLLFLFVIVDVVVSIHFILNNLKIIFELTSTQWKPKQILRNIKGFPLLRFQFFFSSFLSFVLSLSICTLICICFQSWNGKKKRQNGNFIEWGNRKNKSG